MLCNSIARVSASRGLIRLCCSPLLTTARRFNSTPSSPTLSTQEKEKEEETKKAKHVLTRPPKLLPLAIVLVGSQLIYNAYYLWQGYDGSSQESIEKLGSSDESEVIVELDKLLDLLYEKCHRCDGCLHGRECNYFPENHSLFVERMYTYQIGTFLPRLVIHENPEVSNRALAVLVCLFKYDHIVIQALDKGLAGNILEIIIQDKGSLTIFGMLNNFVNRKKLIRHVMRDEKFLKIIRDLTKKDELTNITLYTVSNLVVNKQFHEQIKRNPLVVESVKNLLKSKKKDVAKDALFLQAVLKDEIDMYAEHVEDRSVIDPPTVGHEGKVTASIFLSTLTAATTYIYCAQRWKRLTKDMLFVRTKSIVGAAGVVLCVLNFFHYDLPPSDSALSLVDMNLRYLELHSPSHSLSHSLSHSPSPSSPSSSSSSPSSSLHRHKRTIYHWEVSPLAYAAGLAAVVGSRYYVLLAWYYSRYTVLPSIAFSAFAVLIRDRWTEEHFRGVG